MLGQAIAERVGKVFSRSARRGSPVSDRTQEDPVTAEHLRCFQENGHLILRGFFPSAQMAGLKRHLDQLWATRADRPRTVIDCYYGLPHEERTRFRNAPEAARAFPYKLLDLHLDDPEVRDLCTDARLVRTVKALLGAQPLVCNSLLFERGSQQDAHFDTFFMPSRTPNMMAASWVAIDPVTPGSGPLYYYPKSHLIEPYRFSHGKINAIFAELQDGAARHIERIVAEHGLRRETFLAEPGDVLIWHAQLLHGGGAIEDPLATRCSLVTHYWTELDFPDPAQRLELDAERWVLRREPQHVVDRDSLAEVDAYLAMLEVTDAMRAGVPASFDPRLYLARNQDVMRAGANPWVHFAEHGRVEGRVW